MLKSPRRVIARRTGIVWHCQLQATLKARRRCKQPQFDMIRHFGTGVVPRCSPMLDEVEELPPQEGRRHSQVIVCKGSGKDLEDLTSGMSGKRTLPPNLTDTELKPLPIYSNQTIYASVAESLDLGCT